MVLGDAFPLRIQNDGLEFELHAPPRRVLAGNAAWVDGLSLLIGPERAAALPREARGYSRLSRDPMGWEKLPVLEAFDAERVLALRPDLVLAHSWQNPETIATLRRSGVPVLVAHVPKNWREVVESLELLGAVLGEAERALQCLASLEQRQTLLRERARPFQGMRVLSYTNLGAGGWTSGAETTAAILIDLAGLRNAAAEAGWVGDVPADAERLLTLAPELFLVGAPDASEGSPPSAEFLRAEPALARLEAIADERILTLPPALFTSASSELLSGAEALIAALEGLQRSGRLAGR
jgi:iron complex transport system substrate-binding protein